MNFAQIERAALCDTLLDMGPGAPTLCEGWLTADLAAHLVIRDGRPDLAIGMFLPPAAGRLDRASKALAVSDWRQLVRRVQGGPPKWSLARLGRIDEFMNTGEFFVHHEDVLRAQDDWTTPREIGHDEQQALWDGLARSASLFLRKSPVGLVLEAEGYGRKVGKNPTELGSVVVSGAPGELLLFAFGRSAAKVEVDGESAAVDALKGADFGL